MRVYVWGINYSPEVTGIAPYNVALCEFLAGAGYSVRMITSFCYYPAWQKLPSEKNLLARTDEMDGVVVHRCWHYVPKKARTSARILHELSFVFTTFLRQLLLPRPDLLVVISPPLLLGAAGWLLSRIKRTKFVFHVQDLQPDAAEGLGMLKESCILDVLRHLEKFAYRKSAMVSGITPGMLKSFQSKGVAQEKCFFFPNGVEVPDLGRLPKRGVWRAAHGFSDEDFLVAYSGNIGRKQGLDTLLRAAGELRDRSIKIAICGDGADLAHLRELSTSLQSSNVRFFPLQPEARYRELLVDADLCVVPQKTGSGSCFFPSKLLAALAYSSPILAITDPDTELARAVKEGGFGVVVSPESPAAVAAKIEEAAGAREQLHEMGCAGFRYVERFDQSAVLSAYRSKLETLAGKKTAAGGKPAALEQGQKPTAA